MVVAQQFEVDFRKLVDCLYQPLVIVDPLSGMMQFFIRQKNCLSSVLIPMRKIVIRPVQLWFFRVLAAAMGCTADVPVKSEGPPQHRRPLTQLFQQLLALFYQLSI